MSPADFAAWVALMKETRGWSKRRCAAELDCGINQIQRWERSDAPRYIGYACAALAWGLREWKLPAEANGAPIPVRDPARARTSPV